MDLYPVQKYLKEKRAKEPFLDISGSKIKSNSQACTPNNNFIKYEDPMAVLYESKLTKVPSKRHDRDYTYSWMERQLEKGRANRSLSPLTRKPTPVFTPISGTASAINNANRRFVVQLATEKDQDLFKVPLYRNNIFDIRRKNEEKIKELLNEKEEYRREYNKLAQENRFKHFRSGSVVCAENNQKNGKKSTGSRSNTLSVAELVTQPSTLNDKIESNVFTQEEDSNMRRSSCDARSNLFSWKTFTAPKEKARGSAKLLEGLEEIYQKDLENKEKKLKKQKRDEPLKPRNFKDYFGDARLMRQLRDPYRTKMPFNRPVNGSIWQRQIRELAALETKAEVLRNIKVIDESLRKEACAKSRLKDERSLEREKTQITESSLRKEGMIDKEIEIYESYFGKNGDGGDKKYSLLKIKPIK